MYEIQKLDEDFSTALMNQGSFRTAQRSMVDYYNRNIFYQPLPGEAKPKRNLGANYLQAFADKNIHYTSTFPMMKKLPSGTDMDARLRASLIEKIINGIWRKNKGAILQRKWASDATLMAEAYGLVEYNFKAGCAHVRRLDPRYAYPVFSDEVDGSLWRFYYAVPMTKEKIKAKYGVDVSKSGIGSVTATIDGNPITVDGRERFFVVMMWDDTTRVVWAGDQYLEKPHKHRFGSIPIDVAKPFETGNSDNRGGFFLDRILGLQAEYNETLRRKANIIRKLSNPAVVGKGIIAQQFDDVKKALNGDGGFIGLKQQGSLEFLQLNETKLLDGHLADIRQSMKDLTGFPTATFGESVGANTSGDALSMYFQPTTQATANQWIEWTSFYENLNDKLLFATEEFAVTGREYTLSGQFPRATFETTISEDGEYSNNYRSGSYAVTFKKGDIGTDRNTVVIAPSATPKDQYREKELAQQAISTGFLPRVVAYEDYGILDPEDTIKLLAEEREDPRLHPEVLQAAAGAVNSMQPPVPATTPPAV